MAGGSSGSNKMRKVGRNKDYCKIYKLTHRREHNKIRRLKKHLISQPNDKDALASIERCNKIIKGLLTS